jgi:hypothetical protein
MYDLFTKRVRAAAIAGWWTVLIVALVGLAQWVLYLYYASSQPVWMARFWGEGVSWEMVLGTWLWMMVALKIITWVLLIAVIWLSLWARRLARMK